ncbi:MAG TPA: hypothetical protein VER17_14230 [Tepidisphaeraceae bacterium]|nr:hypothetical protein [Tepidisphaeraceae bacterium]
MIIRSVGVALLVTLVATGGGCAQQPQPARAVAASPGAATQPADVATAAPLPPAPKVAHANFQALWSACEDTARRYGFALDRQDYRNGVITTVPLVSKQFFEVWRNDAQTATDVAESSLATYRRTLRFNITKDPAGGYAATPEVLIERYTLAERPITASVYLRNAFRSTRGTPPVGSRESDRGIVLPQRYWYATGRDLTLERDAADRVRRTLRP